MKAKAGALEWLSKHSKQVLRRCRREQQEEAQAAGELRDLLGKDHSRPCVGRALHKHMLAIRFRASGSEHSVAGEGDDSDGDDSEDDGEGTEGFAEAEYTVVLWSVDDLSNPTFREAAAMIAAGSQLRQELWEEESGFERYERAMELRKAMAEQILNGHQNLRPDLREAMAERRSLRHQTGKWFAEWRWWRRCREPDQKDEAKQNAERARAQRAKAAKEAEAEVHVEEEPEMRVEEGEVELAQQRVREQKRIVNAEAQRVIAELGGAGGWGQTHHHAGGWYPVQ